MKEEFSVYLDSIAITKIARDRIETISEFYQQTCPEEINDIFVTDYLTEEGRREYENLWFFSNSFMMEAKRFLSTDDLDLTPIGEMLRWEVKKQEYDFKQATGRSRLFLSFDINGFVGAELKASQENCDYLRDIFFKYVVPNMKSKAR